MKVKFKFTPLIIALMIGFSIAASISNYVLMADSNMTLTVVNIASLIALVTMAVLQLFSKK